ncbi:MAG: hypothetical protein JNL53_20800 [Cyclobacteriaceae bacterium]|nr:hypothetical protein [Cyclobacteriaceae bacterium]
MNIKYWLIIRDDSKRTFEVCGKESNDNAFTNRTYAMQRAGMNVTCMTPPVSGKMSSKEMIKFDGYALEVGLQERLMKQFLEITMRNSQAEWE